MTVFDRFGVAPVINAAGFATRLGGALPSDGVREAMAEAARYSVDLTTLHAAASQVIATVTGAEAGLVTSGATAGLQLASAACLAQLRVDVMDRLPDTSGIPNEIVMFRTHRTGYDHGLRAAGAVIHEVGYNTRGMGAGGRTVERWEVERAIGPQTVALAATATPTTTGEVQMLAELAARARLPLIVDAAAQIPPAENLRRFIDLGASLVVFSGGKALRGPQETGILAGRRELIMSAALQMLDMDEAFETWQPPAQFIDLELIDGLPQHGVGRGLKVSKESIVGLLTALEAYPPDSADDSARVMDGIIDQLQDGLGVIPGIVLTRVPATRWGWARLELRVLEGCRAGSTVELSRMLKQSSPPVYLNEQLLGEGTLVIDPANLRQGHVAQVVAAVRAICCHPEVLTEADNSRPPTSEERR
jgi:D-glucosaminate-6-phosphate ammonia-lyase